MGVDEVRYPADFAVFARHQEAARALPAVIDAPPAPPRFAEWEVFLAENASLNEALARAAG